MKKKVFVFGTGEYYQKYHKWLIGYQVIALVDNDPSKQGNCLDGYKMISPLELKDYEYDQIYILTTYVNEIREQLIGMGVPEDKIFGYVQLESTKDTSLTTNFYYSEKVGINSDNKKKIVMISHDLSITGAPKCLLIAAELFIKNNYFVTVGSPYDGELRNDFLAVGADVIVDERLRAGCIRELEWAQEGDMLFVNTVQLYYLLMDRDLEIPVVWWIHEPETSYKSVVPSLISKIETTNLNIYAVSKVAERALHRVWKHNEISNLPYGIPDHGFTEKKLEKGRNPKMRFVTIGGISKLKGHDILLEAISLLSEREKESSEFICIGKADTRFGEDIAKQAEKENLPVRMLGELDNQKVLDLLNSADILICASRVEVMSVAVTEGIMKRIPVIIPNTSGNTAYIQDGKNGFVFQAENAEELKKKISYCINHRDELGQIAKTGRETYLKYFSLNSFEKQLLEIFD